MGSSVNTPSGVSTQMECNKLLAVCAVTICKHYKSPTDEKNFTGQQSPIIIPLPSMCYVYKGTSASMSRNFCLPTNSNLFDFIDQKSSCNQFTTPSGSNYWTFLKCFGHQCSCGVLRLVIVFVRYCKGCFEEACIKLLKLNCVQIMSSFFSFFFRNLLELQVL